MSLLFSVFWVFVFFQQGWEVRMTRKRMLEVTAPTLI